MRDTTIADQIHDCVIRDYFTPNVTAEVIIDCLLTPRLSAIINTQCGLKTEYVAKEMSIPYATPRRGNRGCKIDYVLADDGAVYLTELKTTPSSGSERQLAHYEAVCAQWTFGASLGKSLLKILSKEFHLGSLAASVCDDTAFAKFFKEITCREPTEKSNAAIALSCVRRMECAWRSANRSKKYLLTLGEILDYLKGGERTLWRKPMMIIYIAPEKLKAKLQSPHICCLATLEQAVSSLMEMGDEYSLFLAGILKGVLERSEEPFGLADCR